MGATFAMRMGYRLTITDEDVEALVETILAFENTVSCLTPDVMLASSARAIEQAERLSALAQGWFPPEHHIHQEVDGIHGVGVA